jgi:hypothetical protein
MAPELTKAAGRVRRLFRQRQTGHLLLSTLHTNDATATITRLFDLGIQPFLIASSLIGIIAQRLVRQICPACQVPRPPSAEAIEKAGGASRLPPGAKWVAGEGCDQCDGTGLKGRIAIHEVLAADDEIRDLIAGRAAEHLIKKAARQAGMRTLLEDEIDKAARGLTTLEEVLRVVSHSETIELDADAEPMVSTASVGPIEPTPSTPAATGGRVLVVEDSATVVSVVRSFLELEGFEVMVAENGLLGLEMALRDPPDVIVSDVNMPGMGAWTWSRRSEPASGRRRLASSCSRWSRRSRSAPAMYPSHHHLQPLSERDGPGSALPFRGAVAPQHVRQRVVAFVAGELVDVAARPRHRQFAFP